MDTAQFIVLCDGTPAALWPAGKLASTYQDECVNIKDPLTVTGQNGTPFAEFKKLRTGFIYLLYIDKSKDYAPYYYILEKISGHFNGSTPKIAEWSSKIGTFLGERVSVDMAGVNMMGAHKIETLNMKINTPMLYC